MVNDLFIAVDDGNICNIKNLLLILFPRMKRKVSFGETIGSIRMKRRVPYERNQQFHADGTIGFNK